MKYIIVTLTVGREGDHYVSQCLELGIFSCGDTEQEALENIQDATALYLDTLNDLGECGRVLRDKGILVHTDMAVGDRIQLPAAKNSHVHPFVLPVPAQACA